MPWASLPTFILAGLLCGLINGLFVAYFNMNPFVITLGTMSVYRGLALVISNATPISSFSKDNVLFTAGSGQFLGIPTSVFVMLAIGGVLALPGLRACATSRSSVA